MPRILNKQSLLGNKLYSRRVALFSKSGQPVEHSPIGKKILLMVRPLRCLTGQIFLASFSPILFHSKHGWGRNRTADTWIFSPLLCRLSYPAVIDVELRGAVKFSLCSNVIAGQPRKAFGLIHKMLPTPFVVPLGIQVTIAHMKKIISTNEAPAAIGPYSQAVRCGRFVFCSGQIPLTPESGQMSTCDL